MSQNKQQNYSYTSYDEDSGQRPNGGNYYRPSPPTKQELNAPLLDKGTGDHGLPLHVPSGRSGVSVDYGCGGRRVCAFIGTLGKLIVFHFCNAILSITGCLLIHVSADISIALLPLCCLGLLIYPMVFYFAGVFAKLDVRLYNFISPPSEHVCVDLEEDDNTFSFSWKSIAVAVYLCSMKVALGVLSGFVTVVNIVLLAAPIVALVNIYDGNRYYHALQIGSLRIDASQSMLAPVLVVVGALLANIALVHVFAKLSRASTKFFCCGNLSIYRYVNEA